MDHMDPGGFRTPRGDVDPLDDPFPSLHVINEGPAWMRPDESNPKTKEIRGSRVLRPTRRDTDHYTTRDDSVGSFYMPPSAFPHHPPTAAEQPFFPKCGAAN
jgi:hypothetical protein